MARRRRIPRKPPIVQPPAASGMAVTPANARIAFMRFGLGPKPGAMGRLASLNDAKLALRRELVPANALIPDSDVTFFMHEGTTAGNVPANLANCCRIGWQQSNLSGTSDKANAQKNINNISVAEVTARIKQHQEPDIGFLERLVLFWSNHFSIYQGKSLSVRALVGNFERNVIRRNVLGSFSDMLVAAIQHPAMILYLDNDLSYGPHSPAGISLKTTYNENLAREILELHTLGAKGGYQQSDVISLAKALTGWRVGRYDKDGVPYNSFYFAQNMHEPGAQSVLSQPYAQAGTAQGIAVLEALAQHPSTAQHIAFKLVRHFIRNDYLSTDFKNDVDRIAAIFLSTRGNLLEVSKALLELPSAWNPSFTRLRQPYPWAVSVTRGLDIPISTTSTDRLSAKKDDTYSRFSWYIRSMGQAPWSRITPDGYQDDDYVWMNPDGIRLRCDVIPPMVNLVSSRGPSSDTAFDAWWKSLKASAVAEDLAGSYLPADAKTAIASFGQNFSLGCATLFTTPEYLRG